MVKNIQIKVKKKVKNEKEIKYMNQIWYDPLFM